MFSPVYAISRTEEGKKGGKHEENVICYIKLAKPNPPPAYPREICPARSNTISRNPELEKSGLLKIHCLYLDNGEEILRK